MKISYQPKDSVGTIFGNAMIAGIFLFAPHFAHAQSVERGFHIQRGDGNVRPTMTSADELKTNSLVEVVYSYKPHATVVWISDADSIELNQALNIKPISPEFYQARPNSRKSWELSRFDKIEVSCDNVDLKHPTCSVYLSFSDLRWAPSHAPIFSNWELGRTGTAEITDNEESRAAENLFNALDETKSKMIRLETTETLERVRLEAKTFESSDKNVRIFCKKQSKEGTPTRYYASFTIASDGKLTAANTGLIATPTEGKNYYAAERSRLEKVPGLVGPRASAITPGFRW